MIRELAAARGEIERTLIERGAVCTQIDLRLCETKSDIMAYIYEDDGDFFVLLIETAGEIERFDQDWIKARLWPQLESAVLH